MKPSMLAAVKYWVFGTVATYPVTPTIGLHCSGLRDRFPGTLCVHDTADHDQSKDRQVRTNVSQVGSFTLS